MPYNVHATRGKKKGKFTKIKIMRATDAFVERTREKGGRRCIKTEKAEVEIADDTEYKHFDGRRIVEMNRLAQDLWCQNCDRPVSLRLLLNEKLEGVVSKITVRCQNGQNIIQVETGQKTASRHYDSNLKLAIGMLDAGFGETKINTLISALNIPAVPSTSLKRWERYAGSAIEQLAQKHVWRRLTKRRS